MAKYIIAGFIGICVVAAAIPSRDAVQEEVVNASGTLNAIERLDAEMAK